MVRECEELRALRKPGRFLRRRARLSRNQKMSDDPSFAQFMRGNHLLRLRRYNEAEVAFREALSSDPDDATLLRMLAVAQFNQDGKEKAALQTIDRAIGCAPEDEDAHAFRGVILNNLARHKEALAAAEQSLSLEAQNA